jgi:hypothetical protein
MKESHVEQRMKLTRSFTVMSEKGLRTVHEYTGLLDGVHCEGGLPVKGLKVYFSDRSEKLKPVGEGMFQNPLTGEAFLEM